MLAVKQKNKLLQFDIFKKGSDNILRNLMCN